MARICPWCNTPIEYNAAGGYCRCSSGTGRRPAAALAPARPQLFDDMAEAVPEWEAAQAAVQVGIDGSPEAWDALACSKLIEVYTDGSAPLKNPGGPLGFAAV